MPKRTIDNDRVETLIAEPLERARNHALVNRRRLQRFLGVAPVQILQDIARIDDNQIAIRQVVLASVFSPMTAILPSLIADYCRRFPGIEIHLREGLHGAVRDDVRSGLADFGLGFAEDALGTFVIEQLGVERLHVVLPKGHALASKSRLTLPALVRQPLVAFPPESMTRRLVDSAAAAHGLSLRYAITTNRLATLHGLVRNRIGIAVVPASERPATGDPRLVTRPLMGQLLSCRVCLMRLRERDLTPAVAAFMALARKWYRAVG